MRSPKRPAILLAAATLGLAAASGVFALDYSHAAAWRLAPGERLWVDRALEVAAAGSGRPSGDFKRTTRPRLWNPPGQTCVGFITHYRYADGSYVACFDSRSARLVMEKEFGSSFGTRSILEPFWALIW